MMTEISVKFMQLTAVLNKVNLSCVLLTLVEHEGFFQFMVSLTFHIHEECDHFIRDKIPISACLVRALSQLIESWLQCCSFLYCCLFFSLSHDFCKLLSVTSKSDIPGNN